MKQNQIKIEIDLDCVDKRVDVYLTELLKNYSRSRIQSLINDNSVLINKKPVKNSYRLKINDLIDISIPEDKPLEILPENIPLNVVYEDEYIIVINKPPGMLTHPATGKYINTLVNALLYHCKDSLSGINGILRPGIVHRLDKDTSGLIIVAKNDIAHKNIAKQLQNRTMSKYYITIVQGNLKEDSGIIDAPIDRHPIKKNKMAVVKDGKQSLTGWKVLERYNTATLVEARLHTGRTHQLRVHFSYIKHPILGDDLYGQTKNQKIKPTRQLLQAYKLSFLHPVTNNQLDFSIDIDEDIKRVIKILKG